MWEHTFLCPYQHSIFPLSCASLDVYSNQPGIGGITKRLSLYLVFRHCCGFFHPSQDDISSGVHHSALCQSIILLTICVYRFPEWNKVPDFATFSSLLRITTKYELPTVRSQLLEVIHDAYPDSFEELTPSKPLGEAIFSGPNPHPNTVLSLFVQQKLRTALPMAYYMAARRGIGSSMDRHLSRSATLSPDILQSTITGLMVLREVELNETHCLIFKPKDSHPCSTQKCPSHTPTSPTTLDAYRKVFNHIVGSS